MRRAIQAIKGSYLKDLGNLMILLDNVIRGGARGFRRIGYGGHVWVTNRSAFRAGKMEAEDVGRQDKPEDAEMGGLNIKGTARNRPARPACIMLERTNQKAQGKQ